MYDAIRGEWLSGIAWNRNEIAASEWTKAEPLAMWIHGLRRARQIRELLHGNYMIIIDVYGREVTKDVY